MFGQHGTPFLLCENLSRLALLAHLFNGKSFAFCLKIDSYYFCVLCSGCEIGFKAQERLAKELLVKSLSSRPVNTAPLEVGDFFFGKIFEKYEAYKTCGFCRRRRY